MDFIIREAKLEDYEDVCEMMAESADLHLRALPHVFRSTDGPLMSRQEIASAISGNAEAMFAAESSGSVIGFIWVTIAETTNTPRLKPKRYAYVKEIAVREASRSSGVGRFLMERAHLWAERKGMDEVRLGACDFNRQAISFYEDMGYTTLRREMRKEL